MIWPIIERFLEESLRNGISWWEAYFLEYRDAHRKLSGSLRSKVSKQNNLGIQNPPKILIRILFKSIDQISKDHLPFYF